MASAEQQLGYDFEDELKQIFNRVQSKYPFFYHRFPDTKAARGFIAAQPSDFIVGFNGVSNLLEAKASSMKPSLANCAKSMIKSQQIGMHRKWHRSGQESLIVFYCECDNVVEIWDGRFVVEAIQSNKRLKPDQALKKFDYFSLESELTKFLTE